MQESLLNTVKNLQAEQKVDLEELEVILNTDIEQVVNLCKKAHVKPKTDANGNAYFSKDDVSILKKMKELYSQSQSVSENVAIEKAPESIPEKKINFLEKAKSRIKSSDAMIGISPVYPVSQLSAKLETLENNLVNKVSELLSEKMDGFDEIIVELIRAKTENENLRQQVNSLNKQVYILKGELASFVPLPLGLYTKKETDTL